MGFVCMAKEALLWQLRKILQQWMTVVTIACIGLILCMDSGCRGPAMELSFKDLPASQSIRLAAGKACVIRLPNGKSVALWCAEAHGVIAVIEDEDLTFEYGEKPFKSLDREEIKLPGGGTTSGEYLSYIRQGPVITSGNTR